MWELDIDQRDGKGFQSIARKPSAEACKSAARSHYRSCGAERGCTYRIYSLGGQQLMFISFDNKNERMSWHYGNLKPRHLQETVVNRF